MRNFLIIVLVGLGLLTLALVVRSGIFARKDPGRPINSTMRLALENNGKPELSGDDAWLVEKQFIGKHRQPSGLMYVPRRAGDGPLPTVGQEVVVNYQGRLLDGTVFDSSYTNGAPLTFRVGLGQVIAGWDEALLHMRKGEKRTLIVPYWLAYGVNGRPPKIPPRATLVFEVELLDIR
ncbi:MAG: FKBP-type peptidyl-prolyl cis-trans isomerase [Opitutaceae bacterium]|nr:FKBP-type peptidyl-prolyl cis-trans isomerase [Opitutaceae bacterium]